MSKVKTVNCTPAVMKECRYGGCMSGNQRYCDYLMITKQRRGCSPKECNKYEKSK